MCVLFIAYQKHPDYPLIVAANRDEFYERPTERAHFWQDEPKILAGRDLKEMGTWMGVTTTGRFAALTNFRDPQESKHGKISRGKIVRDFLSDEVDPITFLQEQKKKRNHYRGYNLVIGEENSLYYYSNVQNEIQELKPGFYGLSNHYLDTSWPKVKKGTEELKRCVEIDQPFDIECLFRLLKNRDQAERRLLPDTGIGIEWEEKLSSIFIEMENYGTRSSTVLTIDKNNTANFTERSVDDDKQDTVHFSFGIDR